jgi:hypothetical protein
MQAGGRVLRGMMRKTMSSGCLVWGFIAPAKGDANPI